MKEILKAICVNLLNLLGWIGAGLMIYGIVIKDLRIVGFGFLLILPSVFIFLHYKMWRKGFGN